MNSQSPSPGENNRLCWVVRSPYKPGEGFGLRITQERRFAIMAKRTDKVCAGCGLVFVDRSNARCATFCSRSCGQRARHKADPERRRRSDRQYREANVERGRERLRLWALANPDALREKEARRRATKRNAFVEEVDREAIYKRDNFTCQICGVLVNMTILYPHPQSPVLDHILPLSRGGTHEPRNVQLTHNTCNIQKGAKIT